MTKLWMTVKEAAEHLRLSDIRIRQLIKGNQLPATKFGWQWLIKPEDIAKFKKLRRKPGRPRGKPVVEISE